MAFTQNVTGVQQVWKVSSKGGWPQQLSYFQDQVEFTAWSPDGSKIAFGMSSGGDENAQLYIVNADGSGLRALTESPQIRHVWGGWNHSGTQFAFMSNERDLNFFDAYTMDIRTGTKKMVLKNNGYSVSICWSPDDKKLVLRELSPRFSLDGDLFLADLITGESKLLTPHEGPVEYSAPFFSADGSALLFSTNIAGEWKRLNRLDLTTGEMTELTSGSWDLDYPTCDPAHRTVALVYNEAGIHRLEMRSISSDGKTLGEPRQVSLPGKGRTMGVGFSANGTKMVIAHNDPTRPSDIWVAGTGDSEFKQVTFSDMGGLDRKKFIAPEIVEFPTFDGRMVPAFLYRAPGFENKIAPVIVSIHGGPEGQEQARFDMSYQYLLSQGFSILAPNVRGSTGYGKTYNHLDDVRLREDSVKDIAAAVDWLVKSKVADPEKIIAYGGSYGGYMVLASITLYPDLWAGAVNFFGIANFETFLKETAGYRRRIREVEYGSLDHDLDFLRAISPLYKVDKIKCPLMVAQGSKDPRVPECESRQIVDAVKARGGIAEYVLFPDEGHGFVKLENKMVLFPKMAEFLKKTLE